MYLGNNVNLAVRTHLPGICGDVHVLIPIRSYRGLPSKTRVFIGIGVMAYAGVGLFASDEAEKAFGFVPTEEDKARLDRAIPKIRAVDRPDNSPMDKK